jgi:pimeloyl-ACP methyl ester carboxylesterase
MSGLGEGALGLAALLGAGAAVASVAYLAGLVADTLRPTRRTAGWALANGIPIHPEDLGWTATERQFPRADGGVTPAWVIAGRAPEARRVVVILHGHGRSRWDSLRRAAPWVERSTWVVLPDLRGHGDASGASALGRAERRDMALLLNDLAAAHPDGRFTLVGHSLGAVVAVQAAADAADAGVPIETVEAHGPYERVATPLAAHLARRGLPACPFAAALRALIAWRHGPEEPTSRAAARLRAPLSVHADALDDISPIAEARAIAAAAPAGRLHETSGIFHADLGVPESWRPTPPRAPPASATHA